jgi:hypothetical protein
MIQVETNMTQKHILQQAHALVADWRDGLTGSQAFEDLLSSAQPHEILSKASSTLPSESFINFDDWLLTLASTIQSTIPHVLNTQKFSLNLFTIPFYGDKKTAHALCQEPILSKLDTLLTSSGVLNETSQTLLIPYPLSAEAALKIVPPDIRNLSLHILPLLVNQSSISRREINSLSKYIESMEKDDKGLEENDTWVLVGVRLTKGDVNRELVKDILDLDCELDMEVATFCIQTFLDEARNLSEQYGLQTLISLPNSWGGSLSEMASLWLKGQIQHEMNLCRFDNWNQTQVKVHILSNVQNGLMVAVEHEDGLIGPFQIPSYMLPRGGMRVIHGFAGSNESFEMYEDASEFANGLRQACGRRGLNN